MEVVGVSLGQAGSYWLLVAMETQFDSNHDFEENCEYGPD